MTASRQIRLRLSEALWKLKQAFTDDVSSARSLDAAPLEERILMSASPLAVVSDAPNANAHEPPVQAADAETVNGAKAGQVAQVDGHNLKFGLSDQQLLDSVAESVLPSGPTVISDGRLSGQATEFVFVDAGVSNIEQMVADLQLHDELDDSRTLNVVILEADRNGLAQITATLLSYGEVDGIHLVSHGSDGQVQLGNLTLSLDNVDTYRSTFTAWQASMTDEADLLFYGCNLAATEYGQELMNQIGAACDCDVAASEDLTGHESLGGDWDLEYVSGPIDTAVAFSSHLQASWYGTLDITSNLLLHSTFDVDASDSSGNNYDGTLVADATIDTNAGTNQIDGGKFSLDGNGDYADFSAHVSNFAGLTEGTIAGWIRTTNADATLLAISDSGDNYSEVSLYLENGKLAFDVVEDGSYTVDLESSTDVDDGAWHHMAVTVDAMGNKLYLDGAQLTVGLTYFDGSAASTEFFSSLSGLDVLAVGSTFVSGSPSYETNGLLDDVRVYSRALSASDIGELHSYIGFNDAPTFGVTLDGNPTFLEDSAAVVLDADVDVSDVELAALSGGAGDYHGGSVSLVRNGSVNAEDIFGFSDRNGITLVAGNTLEKSGSAIATFDVLTTPGQLGIAFTNANGQTPTSADVDNILSQITYENSSNTPPASVQIDWTFDDGNTGAQGTGGALQARGSTTVNITATNDDPTNAGSLPTDISVTEDVSSNVDLSAVDFSDVDAGGGSLTVTLTTSTGGDLTVAAGAGITVGGTTTALTLTGTLADLNTYFDNASNITYLHGTPGTSGDDADTIQVEINDNGNTGAGGGTNISLGMTNVDIIAANTAPTFGTPSFVEHLITSIADGARSVTTSDIDGDGDLDVLSASTNDDTVAWYENDGSESFTRHVITSTADGVRNAIATDLDGDGDLDVLSASSQDDTVAWYENDGSENFAEHVITSTSNGAYSVETIDLDGDGDLDVLSASNQDDTVAWYENDGSENFNKRVITTTADGVQSAGAADIDGDGDLDVFSASFSDDTVAWYENDGSENFTRHVITSTADGATSVTTADVDGDGDLDVLSSSFFDDTIAWYENDGSESFTEHVITAAANEAISVTTADVDGDGDLDVLSASQLDDTVAWSQNDGSENFTEHVISTSVDLAHTVATADVDGDGDLDVLATSRQDDTVVWYEQTDALNGSANYIEDGAAVILDNSIDVTDIELDAVNAGNGDYDGASVSLVRNGGVNAEDVFGFSDGSGITLVGGNTLVKSGQVIATFDVAAVSGELTISLTNIYGETPTSVDVDNILSQITYENSSNTPPALVQIDWTFDDGNTGAQGSGGALQALGATTVNITDTPDPPNTAPVFGSGTGSVTQDITGIGESDYANAVAIQADGKIVVAGETGGIFSDTALTRYNVDGSLDTTFGGTGILTADFFSRESMESILIQPDGKIVVTGHGSTGSGGFIVARFNADGSSDTSFGNSGVVTTDIVPTWAERAYSITQQPDGKLIVSGYSYDGTDQDIAIVRYNTDGTLDGSFGTGGIVTNNLGSGDDIAYSVTVQADGKLVATGYSWNGTNYDLVVLRYNSDGSLDSSFGGSGVVTTDIAADDDTARAIKIQADGKLVIAGYNDNGSSDEFFIVRYNTDGSLDTTFGGTGIVTTDVSASFDNGYDLAIQPDGNILVAGSSDNGSSSEYTVIRYNTDGSLDTTFGGTGIVTTDLSSGGDVAHGLVLQPDGKIVLAGQSQNGFDTDFAIVRFKSDGSLDTSFGISGVLDGNPTFVEGGSAVGLDTDVRILDQELDALNGGLGDYDRASLTLVRNVAANADDIFGFSDGNGITLVGGNTLVKSGQVIATFDVTTTSGELVVSFTNANGQTPTSIDVDNILSQITYENSSDAPPASVQIDWTFDDGNTGAHGTGGALQATGSTTVNITAINDAPVIDLDADASTGAIGSDVNISYTYGGGPVSIVDVDTILDDLDGTINTLTVTISNIANGADEILGYTLPGTIGAAYTPSIGLLTLINSSGTNADFLSVLNSLTYENVSGTPDTTTRLVTIVANDGTDDSIVATSYVSYGDSTAPTVVNNIGSTVAEGGSGTITASQLSFTDAVGAANTNYTLTAGPADGYLELSTSPGVAVTTFTQADIDSGLLLFVHHGSETTTDSFTFDVDDGLGNATTGQLFSLTVDPTNDAPSFDEATGSTTEDAGGVGGVEFGTSVVTQPDGKIIVAGSAFTGTDDDFLLTRYSADGSLNTSFGVNGVVTRDYAGLDSEDYIHDLEVRADGKILAAGHWNYLGDEGALLWLFDTDGSHVDQYISDSGSDDSVVDMELLPDGRIATIGYRGDDLWLRQFISDPTDISHDTTFSGISGILVNVNGGVDRPSSLSILNDGKWLVTSHDGTNDFHLLRFNTDGTADTTFGGGDGKISTVVGVSNAVSTSSIVADDGSVFVGGYTNNGGVGTDYVVLKYDASGILDTSFGGTGIVIIDNGGDEAVNDIKLQSDGKVILVGTEVGGAAQGTVLRLNADGTLDTTFGTSGQFLFSGGASSQFLSVDISSSDDLTITGQGDGDLVVTQLTSAGSLSNSFAFVNTLDGNPTFVEGGSPVALDSDVEIRDTELDALNGGNGNYVGASLSLVRNGGAVSEDIMSFNDGNGITLAGGNLIKNSQVIATFDMTTTSGELVITFTDTNGEVPTSTDLDNILRQITYANSSDTPPASIQIDWTFDDGNTGSQGTGGALQALGSTTVLIQNAAELTIIAQETSTTNEDTTIVYSGANVIQVDDGVATDSPIRVALSVANGTLALSGTTGITFVEGANSSGDMVIDGLESDLNMALDGLTFTPNQNYSGSDTLNISTAVATNLEGHYTFEGGNADDQSAGGADDGTFQGGVTTTIDAERGEVLQLDAAGEFVTVPGFFGEPTNVTLAGWVNLSSTPSGFGDLISLGDNVVLRLDTTNGSNGVKGFLYNGSTYSSVNSGEFIAGTGWRHVAFAVEGSTGTVYIDGAEVASATLTQPVTYTENSNTVIGALGTEGGAGQVRGLIDDARVYSRALSAEEIAALATDQTEVTDSVAITIDPVNDAPMFELPGELINTDGGWGYGQNEDAVVLSDGSMILAPYDSGGLSALLKVNADGSVDTTFGTLGYADNTILSNGYIQSVEEQADGKLLVSGRISGGIFIARYNADGSVDGSFGTGGITTLGGGADEATDIAVQPDGSIVVVGEFGDDSFISRFTSTGTLDASFGTLGITTVNLGSNFENLEAVTLLADGSIVAVGETSVVKLDSSGALDISFDSDGILNFGDSANSVTVQADGKFVVTGGTGIGIFVTRFRADGNIDTDFGTGGTATWSATAAEGFSVAQQADGKLVVAGHTDAYPTQWVAVRFNLDGSLDTTFATNGAWVQESSTDFSEAHTVSLYNDGTTEKIVITGYTTRDGFANNTWVSAVRLNYNGTLDTTLGTNTLDGNPTFVEGGAAVVLDEDVRVHDSELVELNGGDGNFRGAYATLARNGGTNSDDVFCFNDGNGITLVGGNLIKNSQVIASFDLTTTPGQLVITFTDANTEIPTSADVDNILRQITYASGSDDPLASVQLDWMFDDGNTGTQGTGGALNAVGSTIVNVSPTNDAPIATIVPAGYGLIEDASATLLGALSISDVDAGGNDIEVTVSVNDGELTLVSTTGLTFSAGANGTTNLTVTGTLTDLNSALATITYRPDANYFGVDTLTLTVDDLGNTGGSALTNFDTAAITVSSVNDIPTLTSFITTVDSTNEDTEVEVTFVELAAQGDEADVDGTVTAFVVRSVPTGTLKIGTSAGTATAFAAGTNDTIDATNHAYWTPALNSNGIINAFTVTAQDNGGLESIGNVAVQVNVTPQNDAPTISTISNQVIPEDGTTGPLAFTVSDVETAAGTLSVSATSSNTTTIPNGNLTLIDLGSGSWTIEAAPALNQNGSPVTITVTVTDGTTTTNETFSVTVTVDNDPPVINTNTLTLLEGGVVSLSAANIRATDIDDIDGGLTFTVSSVSAGQFEFASAPQTPIASFTQAQITAGQVVFAHDGSEVAPSWSLSVSDGTNVVGLVVPSITFTNVNDAPQIMGLGGDSVTVFNDGIAVTIDVGGAAILQDPDNPADYASGFLELTGNSFVGSDAIGIDTSGTISLSSGFTNSSVVSISGLNVGTLSGVSASSGRITFNGNATVAHVDQLLQQITFGTTSSTLGMRSIDVVFNDGDGTANGGTEQGLTQTVNLFVAQFGDGLVQTDEDTTYTYLATDFDFTGLIGNNLQSIEILTLPVAGTLNYNGSGATIGQVVTKADIDGGLLQFVPDPNANGASYASFDFQINNGKAVINILAGEPNPYTPGGTSFTALNSLLADSDNFGASGTYPPFLSIVGTDTTIDAEYLLQGSVLFNGFVPDGNWTAAELVAVDTWVHAGGVLISTSDTAAYDAVSEFYGLTIGGTASTTWHVADDSSPIMNGPFGLVGSNGSPFQATGSISYFDSASLAVGDQILAVDSVSGEPTMVLRQVGSGHILFSTDEGIFRGGMTGGGTIATPNDILTGNLFAWAGDLAPATSSHTIGIDVRAINDDPSNVGTLPTDVNVTEDTPSTVDLSTIDLSDIDSATGTLTVILTTSSGGTLSAVGTPQVRVNGAGSTSITLTGTTTDLNTFLNNASAVRFTGVLHAFGDDADTIQVDVTDNGNIGIGGGGTINLGTVNIDIAPQNDAPLNSVPGTQTIIEETETAISGISIADVDAADGIVTTHLQVGAGVLNVSLSGGASISSGANDSADLAISGTIADINNTLSSLLYTPNVNVIGTSADTLTITTDDGGNFGGAALQDIEVVLIDVTNVNDEEVISTNTGFTTADVNEGDTGVVITQAMLKTTDIDNTPAQLQYTLTADPVFGTLRLSGAALTSGSTFLQSDINAGGLTYDHGGTENFTDNFTFDVDDSAGTVSSGTFNIAINPVNDNDPVITSDGGLSTASLNVTENTTTVTTVTATDSDLPAQTLTWNIIGGTDAARFNIGNTDGALTFTAAPNFEALADTGADNTYEVIVEVNDGLGRTDQQTIAVTVTDVDEFDVTPIFDNDPSLNFVDENVASGTVLGITAFSSDLDGTTNALTYSLDDDAGGLFQIDSSTGIVRTLGAIDFETTGPTLNIVVRATSADSSTTTQALAVTINDLNDNVPVITPMQSFTVSEFAAVGTFVGTAVASDVDTVGALQNWTITGGNAGGIFSINPVTGEITITDTTNLNFESTPTYTLTLTVADGSNTSPTQSVTISVVDENDAPVWSVAPPLSIDENSVNASLVGTVTATDEDSSDLLSYSILNGTPAQPFHINGSGQITIADTLLLDFENDSSFSISVEARDLNGLTDVQVVTINVNDVNETPVDLVLTGATVDENAGKGTAIGIVSGSDVDSGDILTYSLADDAGGRFAVDANVGTITVADGSLLNFEAESSHSITIRVADARGLIYDESFSITVSDINEAPVAVNDSFTGNQLETLSSPISGVLLNDFDIDGNSITAVMVDAPTNGILLLKADGSFSYTPAGAYSGLDTFTYYVTDGSLHSPVVAVRLEISTTLPSPTTPRTGVHRVDGVDESTIDTDDTIYESEPTYQLEDSSTIATVVKLGRRAARAVDDDFDLVGLNRAEQILRTTNSDIYVSIFLDELPESELADTPKRITRSAERRLEYETENVQNFLFSPVKTEDSLFSNAVFDFEKIDDDGQREKHQTRELVFEKYVVGTAAVISTSLSVGYVVWLLRGGSLLMSIISSMPAWQSFDPLPILDSFEAGHNESGDKETLASIASGT